MDRKEIITAQCLLRYRREERELENKKGTQLFVAKVTFNGEKTEEEENAADK